MLKDLSKRTPSQKKADRETLAKLSLKEIRRRQDLLIPLQRLSFEKYEKAKIRRDTAAEKAALIEAANYDEREEDLIEAIMIKEFSQEKMKKMASNPSETYPYEVIHATKWSKGGNGEKKSRLVVIKYSPQKAGYQFAVRWQTPVGDNGPTFGGSSFSNERAAHDAFLKRYLEHNETYKKGNISHLPGIAK